MRLITNDDTWFAVFSCFTIEYQISYIWNMGLIDYLSMGQADFNIIFINIHFCHLNTEYYPTVEGGGVVTGFYRRTEFYH